MEKSSPKLPHTGRRHDRELSQDRPSPHHATPVMMSRFSGAPHLETIGFLGQNCQRRVWKIGRQEPLVASLLLVGFKVSNDVLVGGWKEARQCQVGLYYKQLLVHDPSQGHKMCPTQRHSHPPLTRSDRQPHQVGQVKKGQTPGAMNP